MLALPEDMLTAPCAAPAARPYARIKPHAGAEDLQRLQAMLAEASKPLVIAGGGDWNATATADLARFAESRNLPVACSFRRQDLIDNRHPLYVGEVGIAISPELKKSLRKADLILAIGPRLGEMTTGGYTLLQIPKPQQRLVHVHPGAEELGRVYQAELMINAGMEPFTAAAAKLKPAAGSRWKAWAETLNNDYLSSLNPVSTPGELNLSEVVAWLRERLPRDAILTNGAGNFSGWVQRFYQYGGFRTQLAPTNGAMGYGVPAAIAAKIVQPQRTVVCFAGDGDFLMNGQELATAVQYRRRRIVRGREQFNVRHDSHASRARISGARVRNGPAQSRLCAAGACIRRTWCGGREDSRLRGGL